MVVMDSLEVECRGIYREEAAACGGYLILGAAVAGEDDKGSHVDDEMDGQGVLAGNNSGYPKEASCMSTCYLPLMRQ